MTREFLMAPILSLFVVGAATSAGTARADWYHHGWHHGYGWQLRHYGVWYPGYYSYVPYAPPTCYVTVYGTTACY